MGQEADEIKKHIDAQRQELGEKLQVLEDKVKKAADWRRRYAENPALAVALAFGGGMLLSGMVRPRRLE